MGVFYAGTVGQNDFFYKIRWLVHSILAREPKFHADRLEICRDRRDRRSCKIFPSCVKFWGNNANSLGNYRVTYALNE